jgi:hypothetical protein
MAGFSLFVHITRSEFPKIAQEDRKTRLLLLFRTFDHVVYATLGWSLLRGPCRGMTGAGSWIWNSDRTNDL